MHMHPVISARCSAIGWRETHRVGTEAYGVLCVQFARGAVYYYDAVPERVFREILNAPSIGQALDTEIIKKTYKYRRVE